MSRDDNTRMDRWWVAVLWRVNRSHRERQRYLEMEVARLRQLLTDATNSGAVWHRRYCQLFEWVGDQTVARFEHELKEQDDK
jgi:hypothetical protein